MGERRGRPQASRNPSVAASLTGGMTRILNGSPTRVSFSLEGQHAVRPLSQSGLADDKHRAGDESHG
jgi:hypothetical protein